MLDERVIIYYNNMLLINDVIKLNEHNVKQYHQIVFNDCFFDYSKIYIISYKNVNK